MEINDSFNPESFALMSTPAAPRAENAKRRRRADIEDENSIDETPPLDENLLFCVSVEVPNDTGHNTYQDYKFYESSDYASFKVDMAGIMGCSVTHLKFGVQYPWQREPGQKQAPVKVITSDNAREQFLSMKRELRLRMEYLAKKDQALKKGSSKHENATAIIVNLSVPQATKVKLLTVSNFTPMLIYSEQAERSVY